MDIFTLVGKLTLEGTEKVAQQLKGMESKLNSAGKAMTSVGKTMSLRVTAPLAILGGLAIKTAADYSRSMAKVKAVTGATADQFEQMDALAKQLGATTQFTASQVAEAMAFMGMAGMDTNKIISALPDTLNLAAAGALDMGQAANIITNILAGFGMETEELTGAVDVLAKTFTSSNVDLGMLGQSMQYAAPVAKAFGMEFEEAAAIMGIFGNAGIQASMAGTSLRGALVQLDRKAQDFGITIYRANGKLIPMADILEQLEQKGMSASDMMELFGLRAGPAMTALLDKGSQSLRDFVAELENAGGTAKQIAETQMEGLHGTLITLKSAFEGLQLAIADELIPILTPLLEKITELFRKFIDLPGPVKTAAVVIGILAGAMGPLLIILGMTASGLSSLIRLVNTVRNSKLALIIVTKAATVAQWLWNAAMAANPIGLLVLAIGALTGAAFGLWKLLGKTADETRDYASATIEAWLATKDLTDSLTELERITKSLTWAEDQLTKIENRLTEAGVDLTERRIEMRAVLDDVADAEEKVRIEEEQTVDATKGATIANIRYAETLLNKSKLTEHDIRWLQIYRGAIETAKNANEEARAEIEAGIEAEEKRLKLYDDFIAKMGQAIREYESAQTEAGQLSLTINDLARYMKIMGREAEISAINMEEFEKHGEDVNRWAEEFGLNLEEVAIILGSTTDDMVGDIRDLTDEVKEAARKETRLRISAIDDQMEAYRDAHRERMDALREEYNETIKTINAELDYALKGYQSQIDAIDEQIENITEAERSRRDVERKAELEASIAEEEDADRRADLEGRLNELLTESDNEQWQNERKLAYEARIAEEEDADERKRLEETLASFLLEVHERRTRQQLEDSRDALRHEMDMAREAADSAKNLALEAYEYNHKLQGQEYNDLINRLEGEKEALDNALEQKLKRYDNDLEAFESLLEQEIIDTAAFVTEYNRLLDQLENKTVTVTTIHRDIYGGSRVAEGAAPLSPYQRGGVITEPTLLTRLRDMKPYGVMAESRPEYITPGTPTISINIAEMNVRDDRDIDLIAEQLVARMRLRGVKG